MSSKRNRTTFIIVETAIGVSLHKGVDHHVSRTRVVCYYILAAAALFHHAYVSNSSNVLNGNVLLVVCIEDVLRKRNQRSPLTACSYVPDPKVPHHRTPKTL